MLLQPTFFMKTLTSRRVSGNNYFSPGGPQNCGTLLDMLMNPRTVDLFENGGFTKIGGTPGEK